MANAAHIPNMQFVERTYDIKFKLYLDWLIYATITCLLPVDLSTKGVGNRTFDPVQGIAANSLVT